MKIYHSFYNATWIDEHLMVRYIFPMLILLVPENTRSSKLLEVHIYLMPLVQLPQNYNDK